MSRRKNRKLSEEDLKEVEEFIYRKNEEEEILFGKIKDKMKLLLASLSFTALLQR